LHELDALLKEFSGLRITPKRGDPAPSGHDADADAGRVISDILEGSESLAPGLIEVAVEEPRAIPGRLGAKARGERGIETRLLTCEAEQP
jgi:hypothetical protein